MDVLRDFNSHTAWHPVVAESEIEGGEPSDQVGCVRRFTLRDGNHIREQLLALSDREHVSTYCILDATVPLQRYVATVQLKRVTDGDRTFWHWQSTFDTPRGRERELADMVGTGVYEGGFEGLRTYLRRRARDRGARRRARARLGTPESLPTQGVVATAFGGPEVLRYQPLVARRPGPGEVRIRQTAVGVNYIDVYVRSGLYRMIEPPAPLGMERPASWSTRVTASRTSSPATASPTPARRSGPTSACARCRPIRSSCSRTTWTTRPRPC